MAFEVEITRRARGDLERILATIARTSPSSATQWVLDFEQAILSLSEFPERCQIEAKLSTPPRTVRRLLIGRRNHVYRVYFTINDEVVKVLHIWHGARRELKRL